MPIPTRADHQLSEIDDLHNSVIVRLRIWLQAGPDRNPKNIRKALKEYVAKVTEFVNGEGAQGNLSSWSTQPRRRGPQKLFASLNDFINKAGGWLISIPGDVEIRFEALPNSGLPTALRNMGYVVEHTGQSQRILPHAVTERFETSSSGALVAAVENSTKPVTTRVTHAGIAMSTNLICGCPDATFLI